MVKKIEIKMPPFGKARPRVTRHGTYMPRDYEDKRDVLRVLYREAGGADIDDTKPLHMNVVFFFRMPKSWSERKREKMYLNYCQKTPDLDNLVGAVMDALIAKDQNVVTILANKFWDQEDRILIGIEAV